MSELLSIYVYPFALFVSMLAFTGLVKNINKYSIVGVIFVVIATVFLLMLRDPHAPADSGNYLLMYNEQLRFSDIFLAYHGNIFFSFTQYLGNLAGFSAERFFIIQTISYFLLTFFGLRLIFTSNKMLLMSLCFFVLTSSFILLYTNVIRQGLALSLIILSIGLLVRGFRIFGYFALLLAIFSHFSALVVVFVIFLARNVNVKERFYFVFISILPFLPFISNFILSGLGGHIQKIESFSTKEYSNTLMYLKLFILYISLLVFYFFGFYRKIFKDERYFFVFKVYFLLVAFVFFTLPVLLLSSRYLYYSSALLPILYTFINFHSPNIISVNARFYIGLLMSLIFGVFVYSFNSTRIQLGI